MIQKFWTWVMHPPVDGPPANLLIRVMAGSVFFWEGLMKFVFVNQGEGRFTKLGFPFPVFTAHFVGGLEIVGGILLMIGLGTRLIAIPFVRLSSDLRSAMMVRPCRTAAASVEDRPSARHRWRRVRTHCGSPRRAGLDEGPVLNLKIPARSSTWRNPGTR